MVEMEPDSLLLLYSTSAWSQPVGPCCRLHDWVRLLEAEVLDPHPRPARGHRLLQHQATGDSSQKLEVPKALGGASSIT